MYVIFLQECLHFDTCLALFSCLMCSGNWSICCIECWLCFIVTLKIPFIYSLTVGTFETVEEADRAKEALNGADIYSGCCTLKVDWGKVCTAQ